MFVMFFVMLLCKLYTHVTKQKGMKESSKKNLVTEILFLNREFSVAIFHVCLHKSIFHHFNPNEIKKIVDLKSQRKVL